MLAKRLMWIVWPAFLMAAVMEMVVFAFVDPDALNLLEQSISFTRQGIYTFSFFIFWLLIAISSGLTTLLSASPFEKNRCPVDEQDRPLDCAKLS